MTLNPLKKIIEKKYTREPVKATEPTIKTYIFIGCVIAIIIIGLIMWVQQNF